MRRWILRGLAALLLLPVVIVAAGALVPQRHTASVRARYRQTPDVLWAAITDVEAFPSWRAGVSSVEGMQTRPGGKAWVEVGPQGRLPLEVVEAQPPTRLVLRIAEPDLPFGGTWTYEIAPADSASVLTITERGQISNPVFRFMARYVFGYHATMQEYLASLGRKFDEPVDFERVEGAR